MTGAKAVFKAALALLAASALYLGIVQGEWAEAMFNATLL